MLTRFSALCQAYEILSDPLMKRIYDKYGEYSLMNGVMRGTDKFGGYIYSGNPYKVFEAFFGSENPFVEDPKPVEGELTELAKVEKEARAEDIVVTVECELFEFYNGAVKEINYQRKKMLAATEAFQRENQRLNITVLPGYSESTTLTFSGMGDEAFGANKSDLIVKFTQVPLANYERKGNDLYFTHTLELVDALQCKPIAVSTLDNRKVFASPTECVSPQTELRIVGEGMPHAEEGDNVKDTQTQLMHHTTRPKGDLIVKFNITFPKRITTLNRETMLEALRSNES